MLRILVLDLLALPHLIPCFIYQSSCLGSGLHWSFQSLKGRNSLSNIIWQSILLLCVLLMGHSAFHMSIWGKSTPPDGTLAVADGVWGMKNGESVWPNIPLNPKIYEHVDGGIVFEQEYRVQKMCVVK